MKLKGLLLLAGLSASLSAATVTFDGLVSGCGPASTGGLDLSGPYCSGTWNDNPNGNGTTGFIFQGFDPGNVSISRTGGGAFNLNSFEMGISWYSGASSTTVDVTAFFSGGGTSTVQLTLLPFLQTYNLNFANVNSVEITGMASNDGYWLMDNVVYDTQVVPEPSTLALSAAAVAALALLRRRS